MSPRTVDVIAFSPSGSLQGGTLFFSFLSGRCLDRTWKNTAFCKTSQPSISRINFVVKQHKSAKGLKFGDRQNLIGKAISTEVMEDLNADQELTNNSNLQYDIVIEEPQ